MRRSETGLPMARTCFTSSRMSALLRFKNPWTWTHSWNALEDSDVSNACPAARPHRLSVAEARRSAPSAAPALGTAATCTFATRCRCRGPPGTSAQTPPRSSQARGPLRPSLGTHKGMTERGDVPTALRFLASACWAASAPRRPACARASRSPSASRPYVRKTPSSTAVRHLGRKSSRAGAFRARRCAPRGCRRSRTRSGTPRALDGVARIAEAILRRALRRKRTVRPIQKPWRGFFLGKASANARFRVLTYWSRFCDCARWLPMGIGVRCTLLAR